MSDKKDLDRSIGAPALRSIGLPSGVEAKPVHCVTEIYRCSNPGCLFQGIVDKFTVDKGDIICMLCGGAAEKIGQRDEMFFGRDKVPINAPPIIREMMAFRADGELFGTPGNPWPTPDEVEAQKRELIARGFIDEDGAPTEKALAAMKREQENALARLGIDPEALGLEPLLSLPEARAKVELARLLDNSNRIGPVKKSWFAFLRRLIIKLASIVSKIWRR